jgi:type II secretory pathway component GspD/PulD (secretin)
LWIVGACLLCGESRLSAQQSVIVVDGKVELQAVPAGGAPVGLPSAPPTAPGFQPQPGQPVPPGGDKSKKPGDPNAKPGDKPGDSTLKPTTRPVKPATPPNPTELTLRPGADGKLKFNFNGQPWLEVLEWLASISNLSLDWQEVPGDYLNLRTQRSYSVDEARDILNRHLLDRGYTMLRNGEVLHVVNLKKFDPSLVPRVKPEELDERDAHEFVKVSFPLDWLLAETAVEELKPMLSPHGKLTTLKATNRLEAIDAVVNLREVHTLLREEQSGDGQDRLVREFRLQHTKASEVHELLLALMGVEKKSSSGGGGRGGMSPEQQMMQQQQMMMEQQMAQQQGGRPRPAPKEEPKVQLVVNQRENSILAHAAPDKMAVIAQAVKTIDVPSSRESSLLKNVNRVQVYRLAALDPEALAKMLNENGNLDPLTRLEVDKKNKAIIAYASLADHVTIRMLTEKLDGSDRRFEVLRLRKLEADYVAGTIEFMMGQGEKKQQSPQRSYYDFGYGYGGRGNEEKDETRKFRVDADVEHNRLLLWANEIELQEVQHLLVKLGEIPPTGGNRETLRVIDITPEEEAELLKRLRRAWPSIRPNPLRESTLQRQSEPASEPATDEKELPRTKPRETDASENTAIPRLSLPLAKGGQGRDSRVLTPSPLEPAHSKRLITRSPLVHLVDLRDTAPSPSGAKPETIDVPPTSRPGSSRNTEPAPIHILRRPDGRLSIQSADTQALDDLEELITEIAPPRRDYKIFELKNPTTWAYGVVLNLEDFFKEKDTKESDRNSRMRSWMYGYPSESRNEDSSRRLSKRRPLKFISDEDSHTILVTGADSDQLRTIQELIDLYDRPQSTDSVAVRRTKVFTLKYGKAKVVSDALKDVYRDLLSENDKALESPQQQGKDGKQRTTIERTYVYGGESDDGGKKPETRIKFKGLLSIGIDEDSNTIVISATEGLLENIGRTIDELEAAARPNAPTLQVLKIDKRTINTDELQKRLSKVLTKPQPKQPRQPNQGQPGQGQPVQVNAQEANADE